MKKRLITLIIIANMAVAFTGCTNRIDEQVALRDQGVAQIENGDYQGAVDLFNQALKLSLGRVSAIELDIDYYKAAAQYKAKNYEDAISTYTALIKYDKDNFKPYYLRGCVYANTSEITKACNDFDSAIDCDKKNYELYLEVYEELMALGYEGEANVYINRILNIEDKSATATYYKGRVNYLLGQYTTAEEMLKIAVDKDITEAKLYLAKLYQDEGLSEQAKTLLEEYAGSDGVNSEAMCVLGDIEMSKGEYKTACDYYDAGLNLELVENAPALYRGKVSALEHMYNFKEAKEVLTQYLESYPDDEDAKKELIFLSTR